MSVDKEVQRKVVILVGPPGIGKDTMAALARSISSNFGNKIHVISIKDKLYHDTFNLFNPDIQFDELLKLCTDRDTKDAVCCHEKYGAMNGRTPRECLQFTSENVMKPLHGPDHYGDAAAQTAKSILDNDAGHIVVTDGGFPEEIISMYKQLNYAAEVIVINLRADGMTFDGDTRSYFSKGLRSDCDELSVISMSMPRDRLMSCAYQLLAIIER